MSVISDLITEIRTEVTTVTGFSDKKELINAYELEANPNPVLRMGWGVVVGGSSVAEQSMNLVTADQSFAIILTEEISGNDVDGEPLLTAITNLMTDVHELKKHFHSNTAIDYPSGVVNVEYDSTSEIDYIRARKLRYLTLSVSFRALIHESI